MPMGKNKTQIGNGWKSNSTLCAAGLIHVGDELKEVNGIPVDDKKPEEIIHILVRLALLFIVRLVPESPAAADGILFSRHSPKERLPSKLSPALKKRCPPKRQR